MVDALVGGSRNSLQIDGPSSGSTISQNIEPVDAMHSSIENQSGRPWKVRSPQLPGPKVYTRQGPIPARTVPSITCRWSRITTQTWTVSVRKLLLSVTGPVTAGPAAILTLPAPPGLGAGEDAAAMGGGDPAGKPRRGRRKEALTERGLASRGVPRSTPASAAQPTMVTRLLIYRNGQGETFFRLSPTEGRTSTYQVEADDAGDLDRWLAQNGFAPIA